MGGRCEGTNDHLFFGNEFQDGCHAAYLQRSQESYDSGYCIGLQRANGAKKTKINVSLKVNQTFSCVLWLLFIRHREHRHQYKGRKAGPCVSERIPTSSLILRRVHGCAEEGTPLKKRVGSMERCEATNKSLNNKLKIKIH